MNICLVCVLQGALGATAHHLYTQLTSRGNGDVRTPLQNLASNATAEVQNRVYEGIAMYRQDLASIKSGAYKLPWDMTTLTHRQYNPLYMLNRWVAAWAVGIAASRRCLVNSGRLRPCILAAQLQRACGNHAALHTIHTPAMAVYLTGYYCIWPVWCDRGARFVAEATATLTRRLANGSTANWFSSNMYPPYFMDNTFHYQTDGWLSSRCEATPCVICTW